MAVRISGLPELTALDGTEMIPLVSGNITKRIKYSVLKQNILNDVPAPVSDWNDISDKPFTTIGDGLAVDDAGVLSANGLDFTALCNMIVQGTNMSIIVDSNAKTITFNATGGIDFDALAVAMTTGVQSGITVTADTENGRFDFEVADIPTIAIDSDGYWTVDGDRGTNPTKAQGEKGDNGISPHIDEATGHWFVGENDTGVGATAAIDDTSTDGTDVSWSASKMNSVLGDINTVLASVTGGIA